MINFPLCSKPALSIFDPQNLFSEINSSMALFKKLRNKCQMS